MMVPPESDPFGPYLERLADRLWTRSLVIESPRVPASCAVLNMQADIQVRWSPAPPAHGDTQPPALLIVIRPAAGTYALKTWFPLLDLSADALQSGAKAPMVQAAPGAAVPDPDLAQGTPRLGDFAIQDPLLVYIDASRDWSAAEALTWISEAAGVPTLAFDADPIVAGGCLLLWGKVPKSWTGAGMGLDAAVLQLAAADSGLYGRMLYDSAVPELRLRVPIEAGRLPGPLTAAALEISLPLCRMPELATVALAGSLRLDDGLILALRAELPPGGGALVGSVALNKAQAQSLLASRDPPLPADDMSVMAEVVLMLSPQGVALISIELAIGLPGYALVSQPVAIALTDLALRATVFTPLEPDRTLFISATASASIGGIGFTCEGTWPDKSFCFRLTPSTSPDTDLTLARLLTAVDALPQDAGGESPYSIRVDDARLDWCESTHELSASVALSAGWSVGAFTLGEIMIAVDRVGKTSLLALAANAQVGNDADRMLRFRIEATRDAQGAWNFTGDAVGELDAGHALSQIAQHLHLSSDTLTLPSALDSIKLRALSLAFRDGKEAKDQAIKFSLAASLDLGEREVDVRIDVSVTHKGGEDSGVLTGNISLGSTVFALKLSDAGSAGKDTGESLLVATLSSDAQLSMQDLLDALPGTPLVAPFHLGIRQAFLILAKAKGDDKWRTLLGLVLGNSIELAALPVAGGALKAANVTLADMTLLYASAPHDQTRLKNLATDWGGEIPTLKTLSEAGGDLAGGIGFGATLCLPGQKDIGLFLPRPAKTASGPPAAPATGAAASGQSANSAGGSVAAAAAAPSASATSTSSWRDVRRSIGPVRIDRLGAGFENGRVWLLLDAGLMLGPVDLGLQGLGLGFDLHDFKTPEVTLSGLAVALDGGTAVSIEGNFLRQGDDYLGEAVVEMAKLSLTAMGGYTPGKDGSGPSLLLFARLTEPLGGPPYAFVTAVSLGFAVNRSLILPTLDKLPAFPLWPGSTSPAIPAGQAAPASPSERLAQVASNLAQCAPAADGQNWLAAGIDFSSFAMIESSALVTASFGARLEFALLGISRIAIPKGSASPIAFAEIAIEARCAPDSGVLTVDGKLTPASYVFAPDCHLTGGFSFHLWFAGEHAGDFVVTLGGYHPRFVPPLRPAHYPDVARLGLNYRSGNLSIGGSNYFALTPNLLMAGMQMQATWSSGPISAWFDAGIDFLVAWQPFHYDARAYIHLGASFSIDLLFCSITITIHVGVELSMWGPALGGRADIDLDIISFSIGFGADPQPPPVLTWDQFRANLLPAPAQGAAPAGKLHAMAATLAPPQAHTQGTVPPQIEPGLCTLAVSVGMLGTPDKPGPAPEAWVVREEHGRRVPFSWVLDADAFCIDARTLIPSKSCVQLGDGGHAQDIGLLPMANGADAFQASLTVTVMKCVPQTAGQAADHTDPTTYSEPVYSGQVKKLGAVAILESAPPALYAQSTTDANARMSAPLIQGALMGMRLFPMTHRPEVSLAAKVHDILFDQHQAPLLRQPEKAPGVPVAHAAATADGSTLHVRLADGTALDCTDFRLSVLISAATVKSRAGILGALRVMDLLDDAGPDADGGSTSPDLAGLAEAPLWDWPMLRSLGEEIPATAAAASA